MLSAMRTTQFIALVAVRAECLTAARTTDVLHSRQGNLTAFNPEMLSVDKYISNLPVGIPDDSSKGLP